MSRARGTEGPLKVTTYAGDGGEETLMKAAISAAEPAGPGQHVDGGASARTQPVAGEPIGTIVSESIVRWAA